MNIIIFQNGNCSQIQMHIVYLFVCFQLFKPSLDEGVTAIISKGSAVLLEVKELE